jgi:hypothetical protein
MKGSGIAGVVKTFFSTTKSRTAAGFYDRKINLAASFKYS